MIIFLVDLGLRAIDPASINASDLPKFACPDLTCEQGYWAKAVPESIVRQGNVLFFYITIEGNVMFGVNGEERGKLFEGVKKQTFYCGHLWMCLGTQRPLN